MPESECHPPPWITASAFSGAISSREAARAVAATLRARCPLRPDALFIFASFHHRAAFASVVERVRAELHPEHLLGCVSESVIEGDRQYERVAGLSALAIHAPKVRVTPWWLDVEDGPPNSWDNQDLRNRLALDALHRGAIVLADPFSIHSNAALQAIDRAAPPAGANIIGGVASGARLPGLNVMIVDHHMTNSGMVGLSFGGALTLDSMVSQGCRAIGTPCIVTKSRNNALLELGGVSAIAAAQQAADTLGGDAATVLARGLLIGVLTSEHAPTTIGRFGRDRMLARKIVSIDPAEGSITMQERIAVGRTVQFLLRDAETVRDDLAMQLDREMLRQPAACALLFTCLGRESAVENASECDAETITRRLTAPDDDSAERKALPLGGFRASGEFGSVGGHSFQHAQTASLALFRCAASA